MEYLKPIEALQECLNRYQKMIICLSLLLGLSLIAIPALFRSGPYIISDQESFLTISKAQPWKLTTARIEGFTKLYLSSRFEWTPENFQAKETSLKEITSDAVFKKLKDSLSSFRAIAQNQQAKSFFVFEGYGFSNKEQKIEARVSRVLRIKNMAVATPLTIKLNFQETGVSESNPYGLIITGIDESDLTELDSKGGRE